MTQPVRQWPPKDPDAVFDYTYRIPLDAADSIAPGQATITKLSGDVVIDSQSLAATPDTEIVDGVSVYGQVITIWLSGGTDGETALFQVTWTTVATRSDDALIQLPVVSGEIADLVLAGYAKPLPGHLTARYPAFADVATGTIRAWLTDAERFVTTAWDEGDYAAGLMSLAAHNMALAGLGTDAAALVGAPAGLTRMKSGSLELGFTDAAANARMSGGYDSTRYGAEYALLLRRNRGGPYVAPTGVLPDYAPFGVGWPW
jgi:hypothetical protein